MTVGELIENLKDFDSDAIVVLAADSEGNSYSPLNDYAFGYYDSNANVVHSDEEFFEQEFDSEEGEEEYKISAVPAVVLWPEW